VASNTSGALIGFSKDPLLPFKNDTSREGPHFDFKGAFDLSTSKWTGRLMDYDNDNAPEYRDTLPQQTRPYVYFHSNEGGSYQFSVLPSPEAFPFTTLEPPEAKAYWIGVDCLGYQWIGKNKRFEHSKQYDLMHHPYFQSFTEGTARTALAAARSSLPHKSKSFQIISPGPDADYGTGGLFNPENRANLSRADGDNITNFHPGRLAN